MVGIYNNEFVNIFSILKVGVGCQHDAQRLAEDYQLAVKGCIDLRALATKLEVIDYRYLLKIIF